MKPVVDDVVKIEKTLITGIWLNADAKNAQCYVDSRLAEADDARVRHGSRRRTGRQGTMHPDHQGRHDHRTVRALTLDWIAGAAGSALI